MEIVSTKSADASFKSRKSWSIRFVHWQPSRSMLGRNTKKMLLFCFQLSALEPETSRRQHFSYKPTFTVPKTRILLCKPTVSYVSPHVSDLQRMRRVAGYRNGSMPIRMHSQLRVSPHSIIAAVDSWSWIVGGNANFFSFFAHRFILPPLSASHLGLDVLVVITLHWFRSPWTWKRSFREELYTKLQWSGLSLTFSILEGREGKLACKKRPQQFFFYK